MSSVRSGESDDGDSGPRLVDRTDARLLQALDDNPRASVMAMSQSLGLSRNTVQARLTRLEEGGALRPHGVRVDLAALGFPIAALISVVVRQQMLGEVGADLADIPEVIEVLGLSGPVDLLVRVVAPTADHLYETAGRILALDGVERTDTSLVMRRMVEHRVAPLLWRVSDPS